MPYATGQATSFADLALAITQTAALAGWTNHGNGYLSTPGCAVQLAANATHLNLSGGTAFAGGNLTNLTPAVVRMGTLYINKAATPIVFPVLYDIMAFPEEVYVFMNHNVLEFQYLAFGTGNVPGLPGTGAWISGSLWATAPAPYGASGGAGQTFAMTPTGGGDNGGSYDYGRLATGMIFGDRSTNGVNAGSYVHHGITDATGDAWLLGGHGQQPLSPLYAQHPSQWNEGAALLPIRAYIPRPQEFMSLVADIRYARFVRIDYLDPKAVYSLGADRWKVFPWVKKEFSIRDGGTGYNTPQGSAANGYGINHSGTLGVAIRYDGP